MAEKIINKKNVSKSEINTPQGLTKVHEVKPFQDSGKTPTLYIPGMGSDFSVVEGILNQFSDDNRRSIVAFPDRKKGKAEQQNLEVDYPQEVLRKAQALIAVLESKGFNKENKTNAVGHSEGGLVLSAAVLINPDLFSHIVLIDPAGMVGKHSLLTLIKRQFKENNAMDSRLKEIKDENEKSILKRILKTSGDVFNGHLMKSWFRARDELRAVAQSEIHKALKIIHKKGIGVSIIQCTQDSVFPMDKFQQEANQFIVPEEHNPKAFPKDPEGVDGIYTVKGNHNEILYNPERYAKLIETVITALENKYKDKDN